MIRVKIIEQDWKFNKPGDVVEMREVDARWLAALGRVEVEVVEEKKQAKPATDAKSRQAAARDEEERDGDVLIPEKPVRKRAGGKK